MSALLLFVKGVWSIAKTIPWQVWIVILLVIAFVAYGWYSRVEGEHSGREKVITEIKDEGAKLESAADAASNRVTRCYGTGGTWDRTRGVCNP